jgi:SAM-dependent methyltransferase
MSAYLETTKDVYREAALTPDEGLCCTTTPIWQLPDLDIPNIMLEMNYGCGSTTHPRDLVNDPTILYVGVGGGMEVLQFSYFSRRPGAVIGIDPVDEMREACLQNLAIAEQQNAWFKKDFVDIRAGDALDLPIEDNSVDVAAQNCLFNIFDGEHLDKAITEMYRVIKPYGRLVLSDPICEQVMPENLRVDERLRALCLSGAIPMQDYIKRLTDAGFGTIEVRAKRPYRVLDTAHYETDENILIESVEICAIKDPMPVDGPCVFTGRTAIYLGNEEIFDDGNGHIMTYNQPIAVCDKTAGNLQALNNPELYISESNNFYDGGGCC